jgi:hypothetical protein
MVIDASTEKVTWRAVYGWHLVRGRLFKFFSRVGVQSIL